MQLRSQFFQINPTDQKKLLSALLVAAGLEELLDNRDDLLSNKMINEMKDSGLISFGSHTYSHCVLKYLSTRELEEDIFDSKKVIESHLGEIIMSLAYPYGKSEFIDERVLRNIKKADYMYAVTTIPGGLNNKRNYNLHLLPRVSMDGCSSNEQIQIRISRIFNIIKSITT
jgi:peptidoglycan/xylan/chitin deacetylase (PgdA/CDA1 family)